MAALAAVVMEAEAMAAEATVEVVGVEVEQPGGGDGGAAAMAALVMEAGAMALVDGGGTAEEATRSPSRTAREPAGRSSL